MSRLTVFIVWISLVGTISAACGATPAAPRPSSPEPSAWARPTSPGAGSGVVYFTRITGLDDSIVSAGVPGDIAAAAVVGNAAPGHTHGDGHIGHLDRAPQEPALAVPAGEPVLLDGLRAPLVEGQHFTLTITLASGAAFDVDVVVSANPATP